MKQSANTMTYTKRPNNILLIIDLIAIEIALFFSIVVKYFRNPGLVTVFRSCNGLYSLIFFFVAVIYVAVFFLNDLKHKPVIEQDPFEKVVTVIKNQLLVFVCFVCLLYLIRTGYWASRAVIILLFVFSVIADTAARFAYGRYLCHRMNLTSRPIRFLLFTDSERENATLSVKKLLKSGDEIVSVIDSRELLLSESNTGKGDEYDEILVFLKNGTDRETLNALKKLHYEMGIPTRWILNVNGVFASEEMIRVMKGVPSLRFSELREKCPVLGVNFTVAGLTESVRYIKNNIEKLKGKYICFGNAHTSVMAYENREYAVIQNGAAYVMPDGAPISRIQQKKGFINAGRVAGPDFMGKIFLNSIDGSLSMYFYGSTEETIEELKKNLEKNYPGLDIRGYESPPFRELTDEEDRETVSRINASGADIVWVGLGAPKQEKWMADHKGRINALMLGVGAGFDFHAGTIKRAPGWIQKIGMEWLYRLFQDPHRLLKRYVVTNIKFMWYNNISQVDGEKDRKR